MANGKAKEFYNWQMEINPKYLQLVIIYTGKWFNTKFYGIDFQEELK